MSDTAEKSLVVLTAGLNDEDRMKMTFFPLLLNCPVSVLASCAQMKTYERVCSSNMCLRVLL